MFQKLIVDNFQSHEHSELEFAPGVNVIIGQSDCGKSAIMRAFDWVTTNKPSGDAFRSSFSEEDTAVALELDSGQVDRIRGKGINSYVMEGQDEFKAFGQDVPEPITALLNLGEVNVEHQLKGKPFFLLDDTPGEVARTLNKAVALDQIDQAFAYAGKQLREHKRNADSWHTQVEDITERAKQFDHIPATEKKLSRLEELAAEAQVHKQTSAMLISVLSSLKAIPPKLAPLLAIEARGGAIRGLEGDYIKLEETRFEADRLKEIISGLVGVSQGKKKVSALLFCKPKIEELTELYNRNTEAVDEAKQIRSLIVGLNNCGKGILAMNLLVTKLDEQYQAMVPDVCPTCGQEWPE